MQKMDLSIVIPFCNEESNLPKLHEELINVLSQTNLNCEFIFVDDGSSDKSKEILLESFNKNNSKFVAKLIELRRNFGQTAATIAGIDHSKGSLICLIDADLQNDPKDILLMLKEINSGFDAVIGWRKKRKDRIVRSILSRIANYIIHKSFNIPFHDLGCSLKLIRKDVLEGFRFYGESHRILPLILFWRGANISEIVVNHRERTEGKSKYGYSRVLKLIIDIITIKFLNSYGTKPAYVFGTIGLLGNFVGILLLILVGYDKVVNGVFVHRNPLFLIASFSMLLGIQFLLMGLIAELLIRTYFETQKKTIYEIRKVNNL